MTKTTQRDAEALFNDISESFLGTANVTTAKMFGGSALKVSNKVFACFYKGKLVLKLLRERVDDLVASGGAAHFDSGTGRPAKGWVAIRAKSPEGVARPRQRREEVRRVVAPSVRSARIAIRPSVTGPSSAPPRGSMTSIRPSPWPQRQSAASTDDG